MVRVAVELPKSATIKDLKKVVGERMKVKPSTVIALSFHLIIAPICRNLPKEILQASRGQQSSC